MGARYWCVLAIALACCAYPAKADGVGVSKVQIAEGIYQFVTEADGYVPNGNSVVIVNENDVLVFDTFTRPSTSRKVLVEIRKITNKPVRYVVNSHWHPDHWSGNEAYAEAVPGAEFIATEQTREAMRYVSGSWLKRMSLNLKQEQERIAAELKTGMNADGAVLTQQQRKDDEQGTALFASFLEEFSSVHRTYPTLSYVDKLTLRHGGREFRFISMVGDANGETVLYLPKERILITGDVISGPVPYYSPPLSQHANSLRTLGQMDAEVIIPGHGRAIRDKAYLNLELELLDSIVQQTRQAILQEVSSIDDVYKMVDVESFRVKFTGDNPDLNAQFRQYVKGMIENAAREARDGRELRH